jgi:GNAT superfamily N-acetyltransferase
MNLEVVRRVEKIVTEFGESWATDIIRLPEVTAYLNSEISGETFLNYTTGITSPKNIPVFVNKIEAIFKKFSALPNFSIAPYTTKHLKDYLLNRGYKQDSNNAWMFFDPKKEVPEYGKYCLTIKQVENERGFEEFAKVMVEVFSKGEPDDPYQGLSPRWGEVLLKQYKDNSKRFLLETYLVYVSNELAGGAQLLYGDGVGYLDWLSVLPKFRKQGVGKTLQAIRVNRAKELGAKLICLITESGSRNEKIFTKFGFKTEFTAQDLVKK